MLFRIPFMMLAVLNLLLGMWAGLIRMGWSLPLSEVAVHHGAMIVGGFLTTLILLEKVVPLKRKWLLALPLISALSVIMSIPGYFQLGLLFLLAGGICLAMLFSYYLYRFPKDFSIVLMWVGSCCLVAGNIVLFTGRFYPAAFPWWMGFLLLVISGERLELSKFLPVTKSNKYVLVAILIVFLIGLVLPFHLTGQYVSGVALVALSIWMLRHDVIGVGLRKSGLTRFSAVALMLANAWLLTEGLLLIILRPAPLSYDILVHVFFIGYAFSMIFAHGPIILPGVLGISAKPYHAVLYGWVFLVQLSLLFRVIFDAIGFLEGRMVTGIIMGGAILCYFGTLIVLVMRGSSARSSVR